MLRTLTLVISAFVYASNAFAGATAPAGVGAAGTAAASQLSAPSGGANINNDAKSGSKGALMGMITNLAMAGMLFKACAANPPSTLPLCAIGAMALGQAGGDKGAAGGAQKTANASGGYGLPTFDPNSGLYTDPTSGLKVPFDQLSADQQGAVSYNNQLNAANKDLAAMSSAAAKMGYTMNPDGSVNANGKTYKASDFASPASMAAAGLDPASFGDIQKAMDTANRAAADRARVVEGQMEEGGGGAGGVAGGGRGSGDGGKSANYDFSGMFGAKNGQAARIVNPKVIRSDGTPMIGKSGDVFGAICESYKVDVAASNLLVQPGTNIQQNCPGSPKTAFQSAPRPAAGGSRAPASRNY